MKTKSSPPFEAFSLEERLISILQEDGVNLLIPLKNKTEFCLVMLGRKEDVETFYQASSDLHLKIVRSGNLPLQISLVLAEERFLIEKLLSDQHPFSKPLPGGLAEAVSIPRAFVYHSEPMHHVLNLAKKVATTDATVLILGETGTGKEQLADFIHKKSNRSSQPFLKINCASIPENLIENELFGHEKGSYTGADRTYKGYFEQASGGTLFLDEIGDMSLPLQARLLRVVQEKEVIRLGSSKPIKVDVRIILATHADLETLVKNGKFREDLFYRISVIPIHVPALRERKDDIPVLVREFIRRYLKQSGRDFCEISDEAMEQLTKYDWPGNIRELENLIVRAMILMETNEIEKEDLFEFSAPFQSNGISKITEPTVEKEKVKVFETLSVALGEYEKAILQESLQKSKGNKSQAARNLGLDKKSFLRKLKRYNIVS